jgi:ribonuclease-3
MKLENEIEISSNFQKVKENDKKWNTTLNPNNILLKKKDIQTILLKGNITNEIDDLSIWQCAFTHKSYIVKADCLIETESLYVPLQQKSNERLEWLGDAKIQGVVSYYLWERYPDEDEGFLTKLRSKLVKTKNLAFLATKLNLSLFLLLSYHVEFSCDGRTNQRILENTFESFIGAMFVYFTNKQNSEFAYNIVTTFLITIIQKYVDIIEMIIKDENSKDKLMWYFQKKFNGAFPIYLKEKYENECFYMYILEPNSTLIIGKGFARSKKQAEQEAALNALLFYSHT